MFENQRFSETGQFKFKKKFVRFFKAEKRVMNSIYLSPCDENEIIRIIQELESGKASDISVSVLKKCGAIVNSHFKVFQLVPE